jgi:hypothetical protein
LSSIEILSVIARSACDEAIQFAGNAENASPSARKKRLSGTGVPAGGKDSAAARRTPARRPVPLFLFISRAGRLLAGAELAMTTFFVMGVPAGASISQKK